MSNFSPSARLDAQAFGRIARRFVVHLQKNEQRLNDLNVFPVPDGDTGTNSLLTASAGLAALGDRQLSLADTAHAFAHGCAMGARGNSGVILSEYLRGLAVGLAQEGSWRFSLTLAAQYAREAVAAPQEGTILSVADSIAAAQFEDSDFLEQVARIAAVGRAALLQTTFQLEVLEQAGVVDSGALVLCLFHDAVVEEISGEEIPQLEVALPSCSFSLGDYFGPAYEVMFRFTAPLELVTDLRTALLLLGDSLVVSGDGTYQVHIHADEPTKVLATAVNLGKVSRVTITSLVSQQDEIDSATGVVAVTPGDQLADLISSVGAVPVVVAPNTNPSTNDLVAAVLLTGKSEVILLPSDSDVIAAAQIATKILAEEDIHLVVIPTTSTVASLAALALWSHSADLEQNRLAMQAAANEVRSGAVTFAARASATSLGKCEIGDALGIVEQEIVVIDHDKNTLACAFVVLDELINSETQIVTIITGAGVTKTQELEGTLNARYPEIDFVVIDGGQPLWPYLIGAE